MSTQTRKFWFRNGLRTVDEIRDIQNKQKLKKHLRKRGIMIDQHRDLLLATSILKRSLEHFFDELDNADYQIDEDAAEIFVENHLIPYIFGNLSVAGEKSR